MKLNSIISILCLLFLTDVNSMSIDDALKPNVKLEILNQKGLLFGVLTITNCYDFPLKLDSENLGLDEFSKPLQFYIYKKGDTLLDTIKYKGFRTSLKGNLSKTNESYELKPKESLTGKFDLTTWFKFEKNIEYEAFYWSTDGDENQLIVLKSNKVQFIWN